MGERGQAWSMDLVVGVLIFLLAAGIIYSLFVGKNTQDITPLRIESEVIATKLSGDASLKIADDSQLDTDRLYALAVRAQTSTAEYEALKQELGVRNDFCIFLQDEQGNLVYITDPDDPDTKYAGIGSGSGDVKLSNTPCGQQLP